MAFSGLRGLFMGCGALHFVVFFKRQNEIVMGEKILI